MQTIIDGVRCKKLYFRKNQGETERKPASGESIKITDGVRSNIYNVRVYGNSVQDGEPTPDNPQEIKPVKGKNLLDCRGLVEQTVNGVTFTPVYDGNGNLLYVEANGTATSSTSMRLYEGIFPDNTILTGGINANARVQIVNHTDGKYTILARDEGNGNNLNLSEFNYGYAEVSILSGTVCNNLVFKPMIRKVTIADDTYVPYGLLRFKAHGKNLFDYSTIENGDIDSTNGKDIVSTVATRSKYITIPKGFTHVALTISTPTRIFFYDNRGYISNFLLNASGVIVIPSGASKCRIKGSLTNDVQLEFNTEITPYEPYTENSITLSEPIALNGIGEVRDGIVEKDGLYGIERKFAEVVFDGSNYAVGLNTINNYPRFSIENILTEKAIVKNGTSFLKLYNSHLKVISNLIGNNAINNACCGYSNDTHLYARADQFATVDEFKAFFATNPMKITYERAEPVFEPLPTADQIALRSLMSYDGVTYVNCDSEVEPLMELEYDALISEAEYVMYKKAYVDGVLVYSAGNPVTYYVDTGKVYTEEVDFEASCLNPKTFTPTKDGWVFVGWREDTTASGSVLSSKVMGDAPVKLYAVFKQDITCTFKSYGSTQYASGTRYYNGAGVTANASITVPSGAAYSGWTWRGWSYAGQTAANTTAGYANGAVITNVSAAFTLYGLYSKPVYLYYVVSGATNNTSGTIYYNAAGSTLYPTLAIANPTISGAVFNGWSVTAGSTAVYYSSLSNGIQLSANATVYAVYTYSNVVLKSGSTSYSRESGTDINVLTGIDGSKYSAINIGVGSTWVETGRWATVCSARAILRVKTSSGTTYADTILHEMCWEDGYWSGEPYEQGAHIQNTTVTMNLYPGNVGQVLAVVFDGDAVGGNVYVNTVTAIGKTVVG